MDGASSKDSFSLKSDYSFEGQGAVLSGAYAYFLYADNKDGNIFCGWCL